jgi:hypothetical protein
MAMLTKEKLEQFLRGDLVSPIEFNAEAFGKCFGLSDDQQKALMRMIKFNKAQQVFGPENMGLQNMNFEAYKKDMAIVLENN